MLSYIQKGFLLLTSSLNLCQNQIKDTDFGKTTKSLFCLSGFKVIFHLKQGQTSTSVMAVYRIHYFLLFYVEPLIDSTLNLSMALHSVLYFRTSFIVLVVLNWSLFFLDFKKNISNNLDKPEKN